MSKNSEPENFLEIDPLRLDEEWIRQPKLYHSYALKVARARAEMDELKAELDVVTAELDQLIRDDPESYGVRKLTEKAVEMALLLQPKYRSALKDYNQAKHDFGIFNAAVEALEHKKKALENMVYLHGQDYYSTPRAPEMQERTLEKSHRRTNQNIQRRRAREME